MDEKRPPTHVGIPERIIGQEVRKQLDESRKIRADAEGTLDRAEATASEMSKVLRKIAAALDRNPQTWDDLFGASGKRER
jgi:hypothetical protein